MAEEKTKTNSVLDTQAQSSDLVLGECCLGNGGQGKVLEAKYKGQEVAVKILSRTPTCTTDMRQAIRKEIAPSRLIPQHPNIVRVIAWNYEIDFKDMNDRPVGPCVIMEKHEFNLGDRVARASRRRIPHTTLVKVILAVVKAVKHMHSHGILHLDIKPANILVDRSCNPASVRLCDFGLARGMDDANMDAGTAGYRSPEQIGGEEVSAASDVYAIAMTCVAIFNSAVFQRDGRIHLDGPWQECPVAEVCNRVIEGERPRLLPDVSRDIWTLVKQCWCQDPTKRLSIGVLEEQLVNLSLNLKAMKRWNDTCSQIYQTGSFEQLEKKSAWRLPLEAKDVKQNDRWCRLLPDNAASPYMCAAALYDDGVEAEAKKWLGDVILRTSDATAAMWPSLIVREVNLVYQKTANVTFLSKGLQLQDRYKNIEDKSDPYHGLWRNSKFKRHGVTITQDHLTVEWRKQVAAAFGGDVSRYPPLTTVSKSTAASPVQVRLGFHAAPSREVVDKILKFGFADLAVLDPGYFGQGTYFSLELPYTLSHYAKPDSDGCQHVLVCAILWGNAYPVIEMPAKDIEETLYAKPCAPSHDAHVVCVDGTQDLPNPIHFKKWQRCDKLYSEVVIFDKSQILPLGWFVFPERISALEGYSFHDGIEQVRVKWSRFYHQWRSITEIYRIDPDVLLTYLARENITPSDSGIANALKAFVGSKPNTKPSGDGSANASLTEPLLQQHNPLISPAESPDEETSTDTKKRKCESWCSKLISFVIVISLIAAVAVFMVVLQRNVTKPHATNSNVWSSWSSCDLCLATQQRTCTMPHPGPGHPCQGHSERQCTPPKRCADDDGNNCCDRDGRCSTWTSPSGHGLVSQCCVSKTTWNEVVWPSNKSGLTRDGLCCLGSLSSWNSDLVSAVDKDGRCCRDKQQVSGVSKNGTCFIGTEGFSAVMAMETCNACGDNGDTCFDSKGASAVTRERNECNDRGSCCHPVSLLSDGRCCRDNGGTSMS